MKLYYVTSKKGLFFQYIATFSAAMACMNFGMNIAWTSPYVPYLQSPDSTMPATNEELSWCAITPMIGCIFGALISSWIADKIGRKYSMMTMAPMVFASFIGMGLANNMLIIIILRGIIGVADGAAYTLAPMYIGEISDPNIRGFLSSSTILFFIIGTLFINAIGSFTSIFLSSMICSCVPAIHFLLFAFMPESPYYLVKKKQSLKALASLKMLRGTKAINKELENLQYVVEKQEQMTEKPKITDLVTVTSNRKGMYIFFLLCVTSKLSGKVPVMMYTISIFLSTKSTADPVMLTIVYYIIEFIFVAITTFFIIDRFGKRMLLIVSTIGCGVFIFLLALYFYLKDHEYAISEHLDWLPITSLISFTIFYSVGAGFLYMAYVSELFPTSIKAIALCSAEIMASTMSYVSTQIFQSTLEIFGTMAVPFFIFSVCCFIGLGLIIKSVPETKGRTLDEIQEFLIHGKWNTKRKYEDDHISI